MKIKKEKDFSVICKFLEKNFSAPTHWPDWNIVVSEFYKTNFFYFTAYEQDNLSGICPVHETGNRFLKTLHSGQFHFIPNGGWIFNRNIEVDERFISLKLNQMLQSFSLPVIENFKASYNIKQQEKKCTLLVDLKKSTHHIWDNDINSKRRNMIRKAEKSGVQVKLYDKSNLNIFYKFYKEANERINLSIHSKDFFQQLFNNPTNINFDILWASNKDKFLSAIVVVYDKNYSLYWLGISNQDTRNLGQGELLQWEAIKRMKIKGCRYYDLCYIEKERLPQIYKFKSGFSKTDVPIVLFSQKHFIFKIINKLQRVLK